MSRQYPGLSGVAQGIPRRPRRHSECHRGVDLSVTRPRMLMAAARGTRRRADEGRRPRRRLHVGARGISDTRTQMCAFIETRTLAMVLDAHSLDAV
ncbi:hypothetical protein SKAU_G00143140 [Synaphobranchus kaupii]|uniref:Uncharacterized protein n=1 Tax=Synaphobranchus kaupii TaxID=118154 RepID=A0A9Q1FTQ9_SYNKA|nr:hypothetical protein SKAU_G00143140 [Synaphobranchus kaupii]